MKKVPTNKTILPFLPPRDWTKDLLHRSDFGQKVTFLDDISWHGSWLVIPRIMAENQDTTYSCFFLTLQCIALVMALKWTRNVIQSARQIQGLSIWTFLHKYQPGEEALRKMQEYPSNILNVTNVIYMRCMLTLQQDWRISTHWKMLIKLWTSWIISLRLILFLAKKQNKTANEKTTNKQASKIIKRLEIEEHFAAKSLPPDI